MKNNSIGPRASNSRDSQIARSDLESGPVG